jgi:hypothetical protein
MDLPTIYGGLLTLDEASRVETLQKALNWYDQNTAVLTGGRSMSADQLKSYERSITIRNVDGRYPAEQEMYLRKAIQIYQGFWPTTVRMEPFYDQLEQRRPELEAKEAAVKAERNRVLGPLNGTFGPLGITFTAERSDKQRRFDSAAHKIVLSYGLVDLLKAKLDHEGLLPLLLSECHTAVYGYGFEEVKDANGFAQGYQPDFRKMAKAFPEALSSVLAYCQANKSAGLFKAFKGSVTAQLNPPVVKTPGVKRQVGQAQPRATKPGYIAGLYAPGSSQAVAWLRLQDEQSHSLADILAPLAPGKLMNQDVVYQLKNDGKKTGKWSLAFPQPKTKSPWQLQAAQLGQQVTMTILDPALKVAKP